MSDDLNSEAEAAWRDARGEISPSALAPKIGLTPQAVSLWRRVPAERVVAVEAATGIPRERLRPDLYRRDNEAA